MHRLHICPIRWVSSANSQSFEHKNRFITAEWFSSLWKCTLHTSIKINRNGSCNERKKLQFSIVQQFFERGAPQLAFWKRQLFIHGLLLGQGYKTDEAKF